MTKRMDPTIKAEWLQDLRSGDIAQTGGSLMDSTGAMCCLGVLASGVAKRHPELLAAANITVTHSPESHKHSPLLITEPDMSTRVFLTPALADVAGIDKSRGNMIRLYELASSEKSLAGLNDDGATFAEIADLIEEYL